MAEIYSYRGPDGKLYFTDRPISKKGFVLKKRYIPPSEREARRSKNREEEEVYFPRGTRANQLSEADIAGLVDPIAKSYGVDPALVKAVIEVESSRYNAVKSNKGAMGLMQLIPGTAKRFGVKNAWDPRQNVKGGIMYLRYLLAYFEGNVDYVLAGYNAGEHAVDRHHGIPPYKETRAYVKKIRKLYAKTKLPFDESVKGRSTLIAKLDEPQEQVAAAE